MMYASMAGSYGYVTGPLDQFPVAIWLGRRWTKRRGVGNPCSSRVINSRRVANLNELARLEISILQTCTEKKVMPL